MTEDTDEDFILHWSEKVWDQAQLAQIKAIHDHLIEYAMTAWRSMEIEPPRDRMLITACTEGLALMTLTGSGDWRTNTGQPHKPPRAWMLAPILPPLNGRH